jgi:hypothetical protein
VPLQFDSNHALIGRNQEWFEHSTNERWVHNATLVPGFYIPKTWHLTFHANGPERHSTAGTLEDVFREDGDEDWVIYVGAVATEVVYGEEPYESGRVAVSGNITVTLARCICEPLVTEVVRPFHSCQFNVLISYYRPSVVPGDQTIESGPLRS